MKKVVSLILALVMILSTATVLSASVAAETEAEPAGDASLSVNYANLVLEANVKMVYAVQATNIDITTTAIKLLVWDAAPESYTDGSQKYTVESNAKQTIEGVDHVIFEFTDLGAINMVDYYYAVACATIGEETVYSAPLKYSVLEYAYTILGKNGGEAYDDANLLAAIEAMLDYGAAMQTLRGYKTDALANGAFSYIEAEDAVMEDGYSYGICKLGESVTLTANVPDGKLVHNWVDADDEIVYTTSETFTATAPTTEGEVAVYAAELVGKSAGGNFVYEIDSVVAPVAVDGNLDPAYLENGFMLPAKHVLPTTTDTFDVYFTADETNVYVFYDFQKNYTPHWSDTYSKAHHLDCVDFVLRADEYEGTGAEFRINAKDGDYSGTVSIKPYEDDTAVSLSYAVKHKGTTGTDKGYYVEFAIPLNKIMGTDGSGNKMLSFTALSTLNTTDPAAWDGTSEPTKKYACAWKAKGTETSQAKDQPSFIVIKETEQVNAPNTEPTSIVPFDAETTIKDVTYAAGAPKNYVYEISQNKTALAVDGVRDAQYANGVHQVSTLGYGARSTDSKFDMYIAADSDKVYVLYEFVKENPIYYAAITGSNHWHYDQVDFVANITDAYKSGTEFKIYGGVEGAKGTAVTYNLPAWVDDYYVKYTAQGYNVEFSIPLSSIKDVDATGNRQFGYLATCVMNYGSVSDRCNPTADNALGLGAANDNGTKTHFNIVVIKNEQYNYTLNATTDTVNYTDGVKDAAYDTGLHFTPMYTSETPNTMYTDANNNYDMYITADAENIYMYWEVKDSTVCTQSSWYKNDCVELLLNKSAGAAYETDIRFFRASVGTNAQTSGSAAITLGTAGLLSYTVVEKTTGYSVEIALARSAYADPNEFSFLGMGTFLSTTEGAPVYISVENGSENGGNISKKWLNKVTIIDAN